MLRSSAIYVHLLKLNGLFYLIQLLTCFADGISIIRQPENVTAIESPIVELECIFDTQIECAWLKNGQHVDVRGRYSYKYGNGWSTQDCTIIIHPATEVDSGAWQCLSTADSDGNPSVKSQLAWLNFTVSVIEQPKDVSVIESEKVQLDCVFNTPVECMWYKDGRSINITRKYKYKTSIGADQIYDCSIVIHPVEMEDKGHWHCSQMADDQSDAVKSDQILLNVEALKLDEQPEASNHIVYEQQQVPLICEFNTKVDCKWTKDGGEMNVDDRYIYQKSRGMNTRHCSIILANVRKDTHEGNWVCSNRITDSINKRVSSGSVEITVTSLSRMDLRAEKPENELTAYLAGNLIVSVIVILVIIGVSAILMKIITNALRRFKKPSGKDIEQREYSENNAMILQGSKAALLFEGMRSRK